MSASSQPKRRLTAILIADVVGYSRMMERDDAHAFEQLRDVRATVVDPGIAMQDGRLVKTAGDGFLAEFPSAIAALQAAIAIQRDMAARNFSLAQDERIFYRIGINVGDILVDGDDIAGDGVNVASRLEGLAEPGGICVSSAVREQVHKDLGAGFVDIGEQTVHNIERPIRVYRVVLDTTDASSATRRLDGRIFRTRVRWTAAIVVAIASAGAAAWMAFGSRVGMGFSPPALSLAILPFATASTDPTDRALAESLAPDLSMGIAGRAFSSDRLGERDAALCRQAD